MKRIIAVIFVGLLALTGCVNKNTVQQREELVGFKFSYISDVSERIVKHSVSIDYTSENPSLKVTNQETGDVTEYAIYDRVNLDAFIDKLVNDPEFFRFDYNLGDTDSNLWYIQIDTKERSYCNGGMKTHPAFWNEIWEVFVDTTEAEIVYDFGFVKPVSDLDVNKKEYVERTQSFWKELEYPEFVGDEQYVDVNDVILDAINSLPYYDAELYASLPYFYGNYTIMMMQDGTVSIKYMASATVKGSPNPSEGCYGITVDLKSKKVKKLSDVMDYTDIRTRISEGDYLAEYGTFALMSKEEILKEIDEVINETDYDTYVCNFYEDTVFVYLIVDDVIGTDYGIIKFRK